MNQISKILLHGKKQQKQIVREKLALEYEAENRINENNGLLYSLGHTPLHFLDKKVKRGENLTFEESLCGMCYLLAATNSHFFTACQGAFIQAADNTVFSPEKALASGTAFAQLMATKESLSGLTPEEVAGIAAGGLMDTVIRLDMGRVIETCGMGADIGFANDGSIKTINVSTLNALVLAALELPVIKHGSFRNTSAVGSTETIENFGIRTNISSAKEVMAIWNNCCFCYFDAHWCKTIHDLSHLLMIETINHVVGPMSPPITRGTEINKLMGVNEKIHPSVVARAYTILHQKKQQKVGGVAIVCGLDENSEQIDPNDVSQVKKHTILDELSPYASVVSLAYTDRFIGTFLVKPSDFGIELDAKKVQVVNDKNHIKKANEEALSGKNPHLSNFLAMNSALGLFIERYVSKPDAVSSKGLNANYLQECFGVCRQAISSGKAMRTLDKCIKASNSM